MFFLPADLVTRFCQEKKNKTLKQGLSKPAVGGVFPYVVSIKSICLEKTCFVYQTEAFLGGGYGITFENDPLLGVLFLSFLRLEGFCPPAPRRKFTGGVAEVSEEAQKRVHERRSTSLQEQLSKGHGCALCIVGSVF